MVIGNLPRTTKFHFNILGGQCRHHSLSDLKAKIWRNSIMHSSIFRRQLLSAFYFFFYCVECAVLLAGASATLFLVSVSLICCLVLVSRGVITRASVLCNLKPWSRVLFYFASFSSPICLARCRNRSDSGSLPDLVFSTSAVEIKARANVFLFKSIARRLILKQRDQK